MSPTRYFSRPRSMPLSMTHIYFSGEVSMHVDYSQDSSSWTFWCGWGCHDYGFVTREDAEQAYLTHDCNKGS